MSRSSDNNTAIHALNELRALGYLFDGTLYGANLRGANLAGADLRGAALAHVKADSTTILPDGTAWGEGTDWRRFSHPESQFKLTDPVASTSPAVLGQRPKSHFSRKYRIIAKR